jgi:23S rRNA pseudouridine1911/1915/1917 synthase
MEPKIIYEDEDIIVCHKMPGVATQTSRITDADMVSLLRNYRAGKGEPPYVGVIHRLDQPVEGLLVFAKTEKAAAALSKGLQQGQFAKCYYAVVSGKELPSEDTLEDYLIKDTKGRRAVIAKANQPGAKLARLHYQKLATCDDLQLLDIRLETGRFHQIRAQLSARQAPIVGDAKYGGKETGEPLCLCSYRLEFSHPATGQKMEFQIKPQSEGFQRFTFV